MKRMTLLILFLPFVSLLVGCGDSTGAVRDGDEVTPVVTDGRGPWTAGVPEQITVRLSAKNKDGSADRLLGFASIPESANPTATVTFYVGDQPQSPLELPLNHRC